MSALAKFVEELLGADLLPEELVTEAREALEGDRYTGRSTGVTATITVAGVTLEEIFERAFTKVQELEPRGEWRLEFGLRNDDFDAWEARVVARWSPPVEAPHVVRPAESAAASVQEQWSR